MGNWWEFQGQRDKAVTCGLLATLIFTASFDILFDWVNLSHLESGGLKHALYTGPPMHSALVAMLMFNILGTMTYVLELLNTFTILTNKRQMRIPVAYEQGIIMLLIEMPQAVINLSVVTCRLHYVSNSQVVAGIFSILKSASRLYLYGYFSEKEYRVKEVSNYKTTVKIAVYITVTVLWIAIIVTYAFSFQSPEVPFTGVGSAVTGIAPWLSSISILYLKEPYNEKSRNFSINSHIMNQGLNPEQPWLLENLNFIIGDPKHETVAQYPCMKDVTSAPPHCENYDYVKFHFKYFEPTTEQPFGSIYYNYALTKGEQCDIREITGNWTLVFAVLRAHSRHGNITIMAHDPWWETCAQPSPGWDDSLQVC